MTRVRVHALSLSLDGFGAGPRQSLDHPLGVGGMQLHEWLFAAPGTTGIDETFVRRAKDNLGAWILGRNMFGPIRGRWPDETWQGWWGDDPPFHTPVFVLTHHPRASIAMQGGTTFHFVTDGIEAALARARAAAGTRDVLVGGGVATVRQFVQARLVDEMHLAIIPVLLGSGEHLMHGLDLPALGYEVVERVASDAATHVVLRRS